MYVLSRTPLGQFPGFDPSFQQGLILDPSTIQQSFSGLAQNPGLQQGLQGLVQNPAGLQQGLQGLVQGQGLQSFIQNPTLQQGIQGFQQGFPSFQQSPTSQPQPIPVIQWTARNFWWNVLQPLIIWQHSSFNSQTIWFYLCMVPHPSWMNDKRLLGWP